MSDAAKNFHILEPGGDERQATNGVHCTIRLLQTEQTTSQLEKAVQRCG